MKQCTSVLNFNSLMVSNALKKSPTLPNIDIVGNGDQNTGA